jgi:hypothetical protein
MYVIKLRVRTVRLGKCVNRWRLKLNGFGRWWGAHSNHIWALSLSHGNGYHEPDNTQ